MNVGLAIIQWSYTAWAQLQLNDIQGAQRTFDEFSKKYDDLGGLMAGVKAIMFAKQENAAKAREEIESAIKQRKGFGHFHHTAYNLACAYALINDTNNAIHWFNETVTDGFNCCPLFTNDTHLASLRGNPEFEALLTAERKKYEAYKREFGITPSPRE